MMLNSAADATNTTLGLFLFIICFEFFEFDSIISSLIQSANRVEVSSVSHIDY